MFNDCKYQLLDEIERPSSFEKTVSYFTNRGLMNDIILNQRLIRLREQESWDIIVQKTHLHC